MKRVVKKPEVRRKELLEIGFSMYMENGMAGLNIKELTSRAQVATGLFYHYFESKEAFIEEALNTYVLQRVTELHTLVRNCALSPVDTIDLILNSFWTYAKETEGLKANPAFQTEQHFALTNKLLTQAVPVTTEIIQKGCSDGSFHVSNELLAAGFVTYGLSSIFELPIPLADSVFQQLRLSIYAVLGCSVE